MKSPSDCFIVNSNFEIERKEAQKDKGKRKVLDRAGGDSDMESSSCLNAFQS